MRGIEPRTSRMQSERSTIWDTSPYFSSFKLAFEINSWNISFPFVTRCQIIPIISKNKPELSNLLKCFGDARHRTPYLSHAKRTLYHLRYIPVLFKLGASFWTKFMKYLFPFVTSCQFLPFFTNEKKRNRRILKNVLVMRGIDPRTSRMQSERSTIWATSS